jgi:hypothetical protein
MYIYEEQVLTTAMISEVYGCGEHFVAVTIVQTEFLCLSSFLRSLKVQLLGIVAS